MLRVGRWTDFVRRAELRGKDENGNPGVAPKGAIPVFLSFSIFFVPRFYSLLGHDGLTLFCLKGTKNTGYAWLSPAMA